MIHLFVWVRLASGQVARAGELATTDPDIQGRFRAEFAYDDAWLRAPGGFDLDPASLRRGAPRFAAEGFEPPLGAFDDALPDDWGRRLLARALKERGERSSAPAMLRELGANGLGALAFSGGETFQPPESTTPASALGELVEAAAAFERGELPSGHHFQALLRAGSTAGGARPKVLVEDSGVEYIAKFPSEAKDHGHDVVGLEAVGLELARRAGLAVAQGRLARVGARRILLVRRFDVTPSGGRLHMVSFRTFCRERKGVYATSYGELANALRKHSAAPLDDLGALFRHAVFNAAFGNVDDHTKNFWMQHRAGGWRMAPAFDLVPDIQENFEHALTFGLDAACPRAATMIDIGHQWDVTQPREILEQACDAVSAFRDVARELEVTQRVDAIARDIRRRCDLLGPGGRSRDAP